MLLIFIPVIFLCRMLYELDYVNMISASYMKRWTTVHMQDILVDVGMLAALVLYCFLTEYVRGFLCKWIYPYVALDQFSAVNTGSSMVCAGLMAVIIMCYSAACFKYFWISNCFYIVILIVYSVFAEDKIGVEITARQGILVTFLLYLAGVVVSGLIRRLLYKVPVSENAIGRSLVERD